MRFPRILILATVLAYSVIPVTTCLAASPSLSVAGLPAGQVSGLVMATDAQGNIFLAGSAATFPVTAGAAQVQPGGGQCFISTYPVGSIPAQCTDVVLIKVRAEDGMMSYATYLGGDKDDVATGIAVDSQGNVYVTGNTQGALPTTAGAFLPDSNVGGIFAAKLSADGSHFLYCTYLPYSGYSPSSAGAPSAIAVDGQGNAYVTGQTTDGHVFAAKLNPDGSALLYNTKIAGSAEDAGTAITVDTAGNAYITGRTMSADFPATAGAFQTRLHGTQNAFASKLDPSGVIVFTTFLGGSGSDMGGVVEADSAGSVYVAGTTTSLDLPTTAASYETNPLVPLWALAPGGFAIKLSAAGDSLLYSTYVPGGGLGDTAAVAAMVLDNTGGVYLAGQSAAGFPATSSAPQPCLAGDSDVVVTHLDQHGALVDRSYFGGVYQEQPIGLALNGEHSVSLAAYEFDATGQSTPVLAKLDFGVAGSQPQSCLSPDVLNGATFYGSRPLVPGEIVSLTGLEIGPQEGVSYTPGPAGQVPVELGGVQVFFDDQPAPLLYVQAQQINLLVPFELAGHTSTHVRVLYNGNMAGSLDTAVGLANPGLLRSSAGYSTQAAAINEDGTVNGPSHPAPVGSWIMLFGVGFGQTHLPGVTGAPFPGVASSLEIPVSVEIGGSPAEVLYAGAAPFQLAGVTQINVRVPTPVAGGGDSVMVSIWSTLPSGDLVNSFVYSTIAVR